MSDSINIPLHQFQAWMQQLLLDPFQQTDIKPVDFLPEHVRSNAEDSIGMEQIIEDTQKLNAQRHLGIYQRGYIARLRNCMSQQFSALEYALGEDIFIAFADGYLASKPSTHYNLAELGRAFPSYMQASRPDADAEVKEGWIDFMIELAQFEYDFSVLYDIQGDEEFEAASATTPESSIALREVFGIFEFQFPIRWFYTEFKKDAQPSLPHPHRSHCLVVRHEYQLAIYDLHPEQYEFLKLMKAGLNMAEAKTKFKLLHPNQVEAFENIWPEWKQRWLDAKLFGSIVS